MYTIQLISAPSILGLKPMGVEELGKSLLNSGLAEGLNTKTPLIEVPAPNHLYSYERDPETKCLNAKAIRDYSIRLSKTIYDIINSHYFPFVLGGDCSILVGIMHALKLESRYGIIFLDAHADFYLPEQSLTGEAADMDLAIITGRGSDILTNIDSLKPYVLDEDVLHIGQRDQEETKKYGSQEISNTEIKCFSLAAIEKQGITKITMEALNYINSSKADGFWIHYDTDVLSDDINPAVDYRLPGGLSFEQAEYLLENLLGTGRISGISITIFNPRLDKSGTIARNICHNLTKAFKVVNL